jgi:hypothetical protein
MTLGLARWISFAPCRSFCEAALRSRCVSGQPALRQRTALLMTCAAAFEGSQRAFSARLLRGVTGFAELTPYTFR